MQRVHSFIALLIGVTLSCVLAMGQDSPAGEQVSCKSILNGLAEKKEESLYNFIRFLGGKLDKSHLSDEQIDSIIKQLREIQETDPYKKEMWAKGARLRPFVNRYAAGRCIHRLQFQKIANGLRKLPMQERVAKIVDGLENPRKLGFGTTTAFVEELVLAGRDAVPFIIRYKPERPYHRRALVWALAAIGDPAGVDYIIAVLRTEGDVFGDARADAAKGLANFRGRNVVRALIEAVRDQTFREVDLHEPQSRPPGYKPYIGRYYHVQHAASQSLTSITGHDWGLVYNEDHRTWSAWFNSENRGAFNPRSLERTDEEVRKLIRSLYHRYMSGRPNPREPQNALATPEGIRCVSVDLRALGQSVAPTLRAECKARVAATPLWGDELQRWTKQLLLHCRETKP